MLDTSKTGRNLFTRDPRPKKSHEACAKKFISVRIQPYYDTTLA